MFAANATTYLIYSYVSCQYFHLDRGAIFRIGDPLEVT